MPIASAIIIPVRKEYQNNLINKLSSINGITVAGFNDKGIAILIEGENIEEVRKISEKIKKFDDVLDFQLVYFNWEDTFNSDSRGDIAKGNVLNE